MNQLNLSRGVARIGRACQGYLAVALLATIAMLSPGAHANAADLDRTVTFNIEAQSLERALVAFSQQADIQVVLNAQAAGGTEVHPLKGTLSAREGLNALLRDTGYRFAAIGERTVSVMREAGDGMVRTAALGSGGDSDAASPESSQAASDGSTSPSEAGGSKLEEIVVTAQKRKELLKDVPISISVLSGQDLDKSTAQGVNEMLNRVPGVVLPPPGPYGATRVAIRGVSASSEVLGSSSPNAYYLDSVPFGFVRSALAPDANAYDLQRVEVLRGPQGTLYGANAAAGVVRVLTNDANLDGFDFKARSNFSSTDGGGENYRGDAAVNVPIIDGKLAARAVVGYSDLSGWIDRSNEKNANDALLRTYRLKVNAQPTDALAIGLSAWRERDHYGAPSTGDDTGLALGNNPAPVDTDYDAYGLKVGYQFPSFSVTSMTSYIDYLNDFTLDLTPQGAPVALLADLHSYVYSEELVLTSAPGSAWKWSVGGFYRDAWDRWFQVIPGTTPLAWTDSSKSYAVFGEFGRRFFGDKFEWTLGLRRFKDDVRTVKDAPTPPPSDRSDSFDSTTPRAVLTWFPNSNLTVYGSYAEGFRSGIPQYYAVSITAPSVPSAKPDKIRNYEIGAKADLLDGRFSFDAAVYYIDWRDRQGTISVPYPESPGHYIAALANGTSASGPGIDFAIVARPASWLNLGASLGWSGLEGDANSYSGGRLVRNKGDRLSGSAEYTATAFATWSFPLGGLKAALSASANYNSAWSGSFVPGTTILTEGDELLFARANFTVRSVDHWSVMLYGDNLTNEDGTIVPGFVPSWDQRSRPRTYGLQLEYHWK